jgi:hypothetical protein
VTRIKRDAHPVAEGSELLDDVGNWDAGGFEGIKKCASAPMHYKNQKPARCYAWYLIVTCRNTL